MKKGVLLFLSVCLAMSSVIQAQTVTWSEHVAPIIYKHCTSCHRPGEIAPFPLTNYTQAVNWGYMIRYVTGIRYMPPWPADNKFGPQYIGQNFLTDEQIATIKAWVAGGMPKGDVALEPPAPVFPTGSQVGKPDLVLSFSQAHPIKGDNRDEYRFFVLPTKLIEDKDLIALEMRPGNTRLVHHALVWADTTGTAARLDAQTPEYGYRPGEGNGGGQANFGQQLPAYVPGAKPNIFTNGMAQRLKAGSDLVVQVHYAPSSVNDRDSSSFNLFFADKQASRFVRSFIMLPGNLRNGPFVIPPNTEREFHGVYRLPIDISVLGIMPHAHLLGKKWRVFAVTPSRDTIPLIYIPEWNFNWQGTYHFKRLQYLPRNTEIHAFAVYDNTTGNPSNPNFPPREVRWGEGTADEMYYLPILWVPYLAGDEHLDLEGKTTNTRQIFHFNQTKLYPIVPNPVRGPMKIGFTLQDTGPVTLEILDVQGRLVTRLLSGHWTLAGEHIFDWDSSALRAGAYNVILRATGGVVQTQTVIVP